MLFRLQGRREGAVAQTKDWFQFGSLPRSTQRRLSTSSSRQGMGKGTSRLRLEQPI